MDSSRISLPHVNVKHKKPFSTERKPKLLKDFLDDTSNSCSSSGFKSFPRHQPIHSISTNPNPNPNPKTISAFQALINAVKNIHFTTVKSPTFLPRSLSRRLSRKESKSAKEVKISVRVKDILRWTSFRDVAEEKSQPLDLSPSPNHHTITTEGSDDSFCNSTDNSSSTFSWCESDFFTAELLPSWSGKFYNNEKELELEVGNKTNLPRVGVDCMEATTQLDFVRDPQAEDISLYDDDDDDDEEEEQQSPVSVFDFQFRENIVVDEEEPFSSFDQSLANLERTKHNLMEKIKEFERLSNLESHNLEKWMAIRPEERSDNIDDHDTDEEDEEEEEECIEETGARELLVYVKASRGIGGGGGHQEDQILFDFFRDELKKNQSCSDHILSLAKAWMSGDSNDNNAFEYGVEGCVRDMNKVANWTRFEPEQEELALEIGDGMVGHLIDELLTDLLVN